MVRGGCFGAYFGVRGVVVSRSGGSNVGGVVRCWDGVIIPWCYTPRPPTIPDSPVGSEPVRSAQVMFVVAVGRVVGMVAAHVSCAHRFEPPCFRPVLSTATTTAATTRRLITCPRYKPSFMPVRSTVTRTRKSMCRQCRHFKPRCLQRGFVTICGGLLQHPVGGVRYLTPRPAQWKCSQCPLRIPEIHGCR